MIGSALLLAGWLAAASPAPLHFAHITVHVPNATLWLEVADTQAKQERGLMYRTELAPHTGMLFILARDDVVEFWMKDTFIPLDMVFAGADGSVRLVARNVCASSPGTPQDKLARIAALAKYVLELPAGEAAVDGLQPGTVISELPKRR